MLHAEEYKKIFSEQTLQKLFPSERTHDFFEALFGDASEGAYDISLEFAGYDPASLTMQFLLNLQERPGCCLACNLTYGLPEVFSRHPIINIRQLVADIEQVIGADLRCAEWSLGHTIQKGRTLHSIPLTLQLRQV